jgi:hypothetical protein
MTERIYTHDEVWESCEDLSRTFPTIYNKPEALLGVSFGWHTILYKYGPLLEAAAIRAIESRSKEDNELWGPPVLSSAKQKYGRLDLSFYACNEEIWDLASEIEDESLHTCEVCGSNLARQETKYGWITTLCEKHKNQN